jgi:hypothetical protein
LYVNHKNEKPSGYEVSLWLNTLFDIDFKGRDILIDQLLNSEYKLTQGPGYMDVRFFIDRSGKERFPYKVRVPVEMSALQSDNVPIMFLLHVVDGFIDELEVYTADSSLFGENILLLNITHDVADIVKFNNKK